MIKNLTPIASWDFIQATPNAVLIDVRTKMEHNFVGHPPNAIHIPWKEAPEWQINTDFVTQVKHCVAHELKTPILLLCRSGQRSLEAAQVLEAEGFQLLINIVEGFEGGLDAHKHRGNTDGWRYHQLPWEQV